jgi:ribonuclease PH
MAKSKNSGGSVKISFGKKKVGVAKKAYNKHDRKERNYRGQGR